MADAARLKAEFKAWQATRKAEGLPWAQDAIAEELFGFGQSAMSQYLNGIIPLNAGALKKFCMVLKRPPAAISPSITEREIARAFEGAGCGPGDRRRAGRSSPRARPQRRHHHLSKEPAACGFLLTKINQSSC